MTPEEQFAELFPIAKAAARAVYGGNQDYVDVDDLTQEAMLWLLEHPKRVKHAHLPNGGIYWPRIVSEVCKVLDAYVGRERLEAQGYEPFKNYKYSEGLVELVLPAVFDPSYRPPGLDHSDRVTTNSDQAALVCFSVQEQRFCLTHGGHRPGGRRGGRRASASRGPPRRAAHHDRQG